MSNEEKINEEKIEKQLEAVRNFSRTDTPEEKAEVEAFFKYMDAEEERKNKIYGLQS